MEARVAAMDFSLTTLTMEQVHLELFDRFSTDETHELLEKPLEPNFESVAEISDEDCRKTRKRKQSFEGSRKEDTEVSPPKIRLYELDPNSNEHSPAKKAVILKAIQSRKFRVAQMEKDSLKDATIEKLKVENQAYKAAIQKKDEIILQLYGLLQQKLQSDSVVGMT